MSVIKENIQINRSLLVSQSIFNLIFRDIWALGDCIKWNLE